MAKTSTFLLNIEELRRRALARGVSIAEVEAVAGVSRCVIDSAEKGNRTTIKSISKLAKALECDPLELVKEG